VIYPRSWASKLSCLVLSCLVLSCLVLSCLVLFCLVLFRLFEHLVYLSVCFILRLMRLSTSKILDFILPEKEEEVVTREEVVEKIHEYLRFIREEIAQNKIPLGHYPIPLMFLFLVPSIHPLLFSLFCTLFSLSPFFPLIFSMYCITKGLAKDPEEYADAKSQPHVQVALRMRKQGKHVRTGECIPTSFLLLFSSPHFPTLRFYATSLTCTSHTVCNLRGNITICCGACIFAGRGIVPPPSSFLPSFLLSTLLPPFYPPSSFLPSFLLILPLPPPSSHLLPDIILLLGNQVSKSDGSLRVDVQWYLTQQILPPVARLCENIEGTDLSQLAACLGTLSSIAWPPSPFPVIPYLTSLLFH
jgi:hypothetical protein